MIIHGAHNSDTSDLYKNGKHVSKVIRNGKTIWQSGTYALLHNGAIGKLCKGHIDMVGPSGNVYIRDGSVYAREGADEYRITSTGDWPHGGADGEWPHSGDYLCKMVHTEYATGENWHLYPDEAAKNVVFIQLHGELYSFQCTGNKTGTLKKFGWPGRNDDPKLNWKKIVYGKFDGTEFNVCGFALAENGDLYKIYVHTDYPTSGRISCILHRSGVKDITSANGLLLFLTNDNILDSGNTVHARFLENSPNSFDNSGFYRAKRLFDDCYWFFDPDDPKRIYFSLWLESSTVQPESTGSSGWGWGNIDLPEDGTLLTGHSESPDFFAVAGGKLYEYVRSGITKSLKPVTLTGTDGLTQITDIVWDGTYGYLINDGKLYSFTHGGNPVLLDDTHVWEKVHTAGIAVAKS
mgnify:CR=1 FL=1